MNKTIQKRFVDALRSNEYVQTTGFCHIVDKFCAVGVLCDLYAKEFNREWELGENNSRALMIKGPFEYGFESMIDDVAHWLGLPDDNLLDVLAEMNDESRATFEEIADFVEGLNGET